MLRGLKRLNRYERRILRIVKLGKSDIRFSQLGYSSRNESGFRFPIHCLEIGSPQAIKNSPVGLVAGVHGLETVGIRILIDFLEYLVSPSGSSILKAMKKEKIGLVVIPILNPGGVAMKKRSNPRGVDLMRNSGVDAVKPMPFFGGHRISPKLPYFRGKTLELESRALFQFVKKYFFSAKSKVLPILDIHSGFGTVDYVWWPYAHTHAPSPSETVFQSFANYLQNTKNLKNFHYSPQSESYTTHGDLWDRIYDQFQEEAKEKKSQLIPLTLEVGTWKDIAENPLKVLKKRGIFNPSPENKAETIIRYREFLKEFILSPIDFSLKPTK